MAPLKSPVFIICCLLFIAHQLLQKVLEVSIPFIDDYLDSLLAMPIILTLLLMERRYVFRKGEGYFLPLPDVVLATLFIAFVSELVFPLFSNAFKGDWIDVIFYGVGSAIFYFSINRKPAEN